jgi:hypothetical protein
MRRAGITDGPGGEVFDIPIEPDQDVVVLCDLTDDGLKPFQVLFAHEVPVGFISRRLFEAGVRAVVALPLRRADYVLLAAPPEVAKGSPEPKRAKAKRA